jgi:hypothetical protein
MADDNAPRRGDSALQHYDRHVGKNSQQQVLGSRFEKSTLPGPMTVERMGNNYSKKGNTALPSMDPYGMIGSFKGL